MPYLVHSEEDRAAMLARLRPVWREKSTLASGVAGYRYAYRYASPETNGETHSEEPRRIGRAQG